MNGAKSLARLVTIFAILTQSNVGWGSVAVSCKDLFNLTKDGNSELDIEARISQLQMVMGEIMDTKGENKSPWTCNWGQCEPISYNIRQAFNVFKQKSVHKLVLSKHHSTLGGVERNQVYFRHAYNLDFGVGGSHKPIIIDSTYLQFFQNTEGLQLPKVFIGTYEMLVEVFVTYRDYIKAETYPEIGDKPVPIDPRDFDPREFVDKMWAIGSHEDFREFYESK